MKSKEKHLKRNEIYDISQKNKNKESVMKRIITALMALFLFIPMALHASGTAAGVGVTNTVTAIYSNLGNTPYSNKAYETNTVNAIYGLKSDYSNYAVKYVAPGAGTTFMMSVTNRGNTSVVIALSNYRIATVGTHSWYYNFYTNVSTSGGAFKSFTLAEDDFQTFYLYMRADAAAVDGESSTNIWGSQISNAGVYNSVYGALSGLTAYTSMNGTTIFGGRDFITNGIAIAIVQAPSIVISKRSEVTNSASFMALAAGAHWKDVVPGSEIVYVITWTNAGSGFVKHLSFSDPINTTVFDFVSGSLAYTNDVKITSDYFISYKTAFDAGKVLADDGSTPIKSLAKNYGLTGSANSGSVVFSYSSNIPGSAKGTLMYKVRVK